MPMFLQTLFCLIFCKTLEIKYMDENVLYDFS